MVAEDNQANENNALVSATRGDTKFPYRIAERYHCKGYLGGGGSGLVFKAWDDMLQRMVAIKFIRAPSFIARQRLVGEARALAKVNHPSICSIYDIGEPVDEHSSLFMVMELIEGPRLAELSGLISTEQAIEMIHKLAEGVSELHAVGLVHNDINPGNVIIKQHNSEEPLPTLIDLSIAGRPSTSGQIRSFGVTPLFAAPEQRSGHPIPSDALEKVDVYNLGALLFFLITGQAPTTNPETQLKAHRQQCNRELRRFILRCLAPEPSKRFHSVAEVARLLGGLRYHKSNWRPTAIAAFLVITAIVGVYSFINADLGDTNDMPSERIDLLSQASMHALYAVQLQQDAKLNEARKQAHKSVQYYRQAILLSNGQSIRPLVQLVDFLVNAKSLFSRSELSALLLDTVAQTETSANTNNSHQLAFALAQIYYQLATLHQSQLSLSTRWAERASEEINRALDQQPDSSRYHMLRCKIRELRHQPNDGTC